MSFIYHTFFFDPLYNLLMAILSILPSTDAGIAIILLTIIVRALIYPLSKKSITTQIKTSEIAPELNKIKEKYKKEPEEQARRILALYKEKGVNPFSGILVIIIQLPIIFAVYSIFLHFPEIRENLLYPFITVPQEINTMFLGLTDITKKSIIFALLAALTTYIQLKISLKNTTPPQGNSFGDNLARSMQTQMKYLFPVIVFFICYTISGAIALYWFVTNLCSIGQEMYIRRKLKPTQA